MFSSLTLSRPLIISLAVISTIGVVSAAFFQFSGTAGTPHVLGQFFSDGTTGNAGTVSFDPAPTALCGGSNAGLEWVELKWYFCLETLGKATFNGATIIPSLSRRATDLLKVVGTANSSGGLIYFQSGTYETYYDPAGGRLVGEWWNLWVGRVTFGVAVITLPSWVAVIDPTAPISTTATTITSTAWIGFEWRVKVLGNIGGNSAFNSSNALGSSFNASLMNDTLQKVRKNVALLTRNIPSGFANAFDLYTPKALSNKIIYINNTAVYQKLSYSSIPTSFPTPSVDSLILIGMDLIIDGNIINADTKAKGIIVLKNEAWVGGNIIVTNSVKNIDSSMFVEGSLYSGIDKDSLYNGTTEGALTLGNNQLYIRGSLISRNTIGGSFTDPATCVYGETTTTCTNERSIQYDLNYFRQTPPNRDPVPPAQSTRSYGDGSLDSYSLIIELDPRLAATPPPGF